MITASMAMASTTSTPPARHGFVPGALEHAHAHDVQVHVAALPGELEHEGAVKRQIHQAFETTKHTNRGK